MGWLSRIFTGSRPDHTKRQYHGNCSVYRVGNDFCNSSDEEPNNEEGREEVDTRGKRSDLEEESEDEQLSRTSQDTSNNWHHDYNDPINDHGVWHHDYNEPINDHDYNEPINDHGVWHHDYNEPINNHGYSYYGTYPSQQFCYTDSIRPQCYVCKQYIPTEYIVNSFWEVEMCPSHVLDDIKKCCSCGLMEQIDTRYVTLDYGRKICLECLKFSVMSNDECEPLYLNVQEFFEGLNMKVEQEVPLLLVELQVLNDVLGVPTDSYNFGGLYLTEEQTVSTISRRPSIGADYEITDIVTEPYRLVDAVGILVLYGLPRLLLGSIIAHEMMHAWMNLEGKFKPDKQVEEGMCQVLAHMWLDSEIMSSSISQFERKLGEYYKGQIEVEDSPIYGDGFRAGKQAVLQYGLRDTLEHIRSTGSFPSSTWY